MNEPYRTQFEVCCAFNGFCKKVLRCEASNAWRDVRNRQLREISFSNLSPEEEAQLYTADTYAFDEADKSFFVAGKSFTAKQLADALHTLPEEKRKAVLLYYFFDMTDAQIAQHLNIPRSTVQFRRTSSYELLKNIWRVELMMKVNGNSDFDESGLLPYPVIIAATKGDPDAVKTVVKHYEGYISSLATRRLRDERGNTYYGIDEDIRDRLHSRLIKAILEFKI